VQLFSQSDRHFVWLAMANVHIMYHTSRACSPLLSESWPAGQPRAQLFVPVLRELKLYVPACLAEIWASLSQRRPRFQRDKRPRTTQWPGVPVATTWALYNLSGLIFGDQRWQLICHPTGLNQAESIISTEAKKQRTPRNEGLNGGLQDPS